jgi:hypothetical protein
MVIDMTAQLAPLIMGTEIALVVAASAVLVSAWRADRDSTSEQTSNGNVRDLAIVGLSPSAPAPADDAPSDTSIPEAA